MSKKKKLVQRYNGTEFTDNCPCHDVPWDEHDKLLNTEKKEWAV